MKVLIVEDDIVSRELFRVVIQKEGYDCQFAEDGIQGLEIFNEFLPDVVISDIRMPRLDGIELLKRIRKVERNVIVIMVTAHGNEDIALQALQSGANNYLKKPVSLDELKVQLERYKSVLDNTLHKQDVSSLVKDQELNLSIESNLDYVPVLAEYLTQKVKHVFTPSELISLELGLSELILNAIEHGNFGITSRDKKTALEQNTLVELYNEKRNQTEFSQRKVQIKFVKNTHSCEWIIKDEGEGFDWRLLPNPDVQKSHDELQGRGVYISKLQFDDIQYLGIGNTVSAKKYIQK